MLAKHMLLKIINIVIRTVNCGKSNLSGLINCGNKAVRNIIAFGLLIAIPNAFKNILRDETQCKLDLGFDKSN